MSFVSFRKTFFPTEEEIKALKKRMEEIHNKCVEDRKNVKLVQDKKDPFLYCREPFGSFLGDCCIKGWFPGSPELYVCTGVKHPFVVDNIDHNCTEYADRAASDKAEVVRCPHCNESYYQELYRATTCVYTPVIYKDGELISKIPDTVRIVCHCLNCGKDFSHMSKERNK